MDHTKRCPRAALTAALALSLLAPACALSACSRAATSDTPDPPAVAASGQGPAAELRLGYLPNVTHAAALIGVDKGYFGKELGRTRLTTQTFNAGPDEVSALLGGSLDAAFLGSGPAVNAFAKSGGAAVRLVAGAASGGAQLVVRPDIGSPAQLRGTTLATPQLGNTQDVSLKTWLAGQHLTGQVTVTNLANAQTLTEFRRGDIQGGWLPEPFASELVLAGGAKVLVDESTLWPGGRFPTTVLIVRTAYLNQHRATVSALIKGESDAIDYAHNDLSGGESAVDDELRLVSGQALPRAVVDRAFERIELTLDPLAEDFTALADDQVTAGIAAAAPRLTGFADLTALNTVLRDAGRPPVSGGALSGD